MWYWEGDRTSGGRSPGGVRGEPEQVLIAYWRPPGLGPSFPRPLGSKLGVWVPRMPEPQTSPAECLPVLDIMSRPRAGGSGVGKSQSHQSGMLAPMSLCLARQPYRSQGRKGPQSWPRRRRRRGAGSGRRAPLSCDGHSGSASPGARGTGAPSATSPPACGCPGRPSTGPPPRLLHREWGLSRRLRAPHRDPAQPRPAAPHLAG